MAEIAYNEGPIDFEDFIDYWLRHYRYRKAAKPLQAFHEERMALLAGDFSIPVENLRFWELGIGIWPYIIESVAELAVASHTPWGGWLAYTYRKGEKDIHKKHGKEIGTLARRLKRANRDFFRDLVANAYPDSVSLTSSHESLWERGLPKKEPDPDDFF